MPDQPEEYEKTFSAIVTIKNGRARWILIIHYQNFKARVSGLFHKSSAEEKEVAHGPFFLVY